MKRYIIVPVTFVVGLGAGWYFGYTRPVTKGYRELKAALHLTEMPDKQMAEAGAQIRDHMPEFIERMKRSDDMAASLALGSFKREEQGNVDGAKKLQLQFIGNYYRQYHAKGGDGKILGSIEEAAKQSPDIAAAIATKE
jgi:hypothetical protein